MYGIPQLLVAPIGEPVSVAEAREWVRLGAEQTFADDRLAKLIRRATRHIERISGRQLLTATYQITLAGFPGMEGWGGVMAPSSGPLFGIRMPKAPLQSVSAITYYDLANVLQTLSTSVYDVTTSLDPGLVTLGQYQIWPITRLRPDAVQITFTAGYGMLASDVPDEYLQAIEMLVVQWYERRGDDGGDEPAAVARLLAGVNNGELEYGA